LFLFPGPVFPQQPALTVRAKVGLGGDFKAGGPYRIGAWAPAAVEIANAGGTFQGRIEVDAEGPDGASILSAAPVAVARGTVKRVTLLVRPYTSQREFRVRLVDAAGRTVHALDAPGEPVDPMRLVGVVTALGRPGLPVADPDARRIRVVYLDAADLADDPRAYDALDALAALEPRPEAADPVAAARALRAWVAGGRLAVVTVGAAGPALAGGPFAWAAAPVARSSETDAFDALRAALAPRADGIPPRRATVPDLRGQPGHVLAADPGGLPLAIERTVGLGRLRLVAPDLQAAPFPAWGGLAALWDRLLELPARRMQETRFFTGDRDPLQAAFETLRFLVPVSIGFVILFLAAYIVAVGPGDWLLLRALGRRYAWTWITVPAWSLLFCGLLYAATAYKRGGDVIVRAASVVDVVPGEGTRGVSYVAVYSPSSRRFDYRVEADSGWVAPRGVGEAGGGISFGGSGGTYAADGSAGFLGFPIASNVMRTVEAEWRLAGGPYAAELADAGDGRLRLVNRGTRPLQRVTLLLAGVKAAPAAAIELTPGTSVEIPSATATVEQLLLAEEKAATVASGGGGVDEDDVSSVAQDQAFLARAWLALLRSSLGELDRREVDAERGSRSRPREPRDRRLDAAPILPRFRAVVLARDGASPAPVQVNGERPRVTETVLVRIWIP
jgi:hypothetical protein